MEKRKDHTFPDSFILSHYAIIATLIVLLDKSKLTNTVKAHCKTGLKVIGIIHGDLSYNARTKLLLEKEFNGFFVIFPKVYFNNRALIPTVMIIENIALCIKKNVVVDVI